MQAQLEHDLKELQEHLGSERGELADLVAKQERIASKISEIRAQRTGEEMKLASGDSAAHKKLDALDQDLHRLERETAGISALQGQVQARIAEIEKAVLETNSVLARQQLEEQGRALITEARERLEDFLRQYEAATVALGACSATYESLQQFADQADSSAARNEAAGIALALNQLNHVRLQQRGFRPVANRIGGLAVTVTGMLPPVQ